MSKYTSKAIADSFMELLQKKSLDKITVKDIIELAEINRNTFYYHFQDIYDLLDKIFRDEAIRFRSESNPTASFYEESVRLVLFLQEHRAAIVHIYNSKSKEVLNQYLEASIEHFVIRFVKKAAEGTNLSDKGVEYITRFYTYGIIGLTTYWLERKMPDYKEDLIQTMSISFEATIEDMICAYIESHKDECNKIE